MTVILDRPSTTEAERNRRTELVRRAAALVPLLKRNAQKTENGRRVADENIAAIEQEGLFRITQPKRFGGLEVDFRTKLEVIRELARGCGSTSWTTNLLTDGAWAVGMWNEEAQNDVWAKNPKARIAGVLAPAGKAEKVHDGYRITGRWANCSGCLHAQWVVLGVMVQDSDGQPVDTGLVLVPISEVSIEDTWFVAGMKGTGSNTVVASDVFVPGHRFVSMHKLQSGENDNPYKDEVLYRAPFVSGATINLAAPQLGLARAALELVIDGAAKRGIAYTYYDVQAEAPGVQLSIAKAASLIDTAELLAYRAAAEVDDAAYRGVLPDYLTRARIRMDTAQAIVRAREAISELISVHGAASFADANPLQRIWRDSEVAGRHAIGNPAIGAEVYGRALLGFTSGVTPLV
jgi:3-hydroxy-9,10-secoandrosta-1,3,5(10)-triene-9,17-dione monooxygenase